jgi:hypothetical protein
MGQRGQLVGRSIGLFGNMRVGTKDKTTFNVSYSFNQIPQIIPRVITITIFHQIFYLIFYQQHTD